MQGIKVTFCSLAEDEKKHLAMPRMAEHTWTHSEGADSSPWCVCMCVCAHEGEFRSMKRRLHKLLEGKKNKKSIIFLPIQ